MSHLLQVRNLSKFFGGLAAIHDVESQVNRGEILSIIGTNGAGKTTLFNLLTGIHQPSGGGRSKLWPKTGRGRNWWGSTFTGSGGG